MGWQVQVQPAAYIPQVSTDSTVRTVTGTSFAQLSGSFTIPANDAHAGSVYKLTCWGNYTVSVATLITFQPVIFGTSLTTLATVLQTSTAVGFTLETQVMVVTAGASGSIRAYIQFVSGCGGAAQDITASSVNTTVSSSFLMNAEWATGRSISGEASIYERDGPGAFPH